MSGTPRVLVTDGAVTYQVAVCVSKNGGGTNPLQRIIDASNGTDSYHAVVPAEQTLAQVARQLAASKSGRPADGFRAWTEDEALLDQPISNWDDKV